ncbi:hypothetical protein [Desulfosporosinus sp. OT]|nr:hypothetical protein [Desulfosporosinus sp. OT]EGW36478.1 hypothetical protein DOT_5642 [Desulfosporosinus sp. OT]
MNAESVRDKLANAQLVMKRISVNIRSMISAGGTFLVKALKLVDNVVDKL